MISAAHIRRRRRSGPGYAVGGLSPGLTLDFARHHYRLGSVSAPFDTALTFTGTGSRDYTDASGSTVTAAANEPRLGHHINENGAWVNKGLRFDSSVETLKIPSANIPTYTDEFSILIKGTMTYSDNNELAEVMFFQWEDTVFDRTFCRLRTNGISTGQPNWFMRGNSGPNVNSVGPVDAFSPGTNVPFSLASRHGPDFLEGAYNGISAEIGTDGSDIPDLNAAEFQIAPTFNGTIERILIWPSDIGSAGILEASA